MCQEVEVGVDKLVELLGRGVRVSYILFMRKRGGEGSGPIDGAHHTINEREKNGCKLELSTSRLISSQW
jgi:hypothetical protein